VEAVAEVVEEAAEVELVVVPVLLGLLALPAALVLLELLVLPEPLEQDKGTLGQTPLVIPAQATIQVRDMVKVEAKGKEKADVRSH